MADLLDYFGANIATSRPANFGWILFDYPFNSYNTNTYGSLDIVTLMISSNHGYEGYTETFKVI